MGDTVSELRIMSTNVNLEPGTKMTEFQAEGEEITAFKLGTEKNTVPK
jgi:hypothetical protein